MAKHVNKGLAVEDWPQEDREMFASLVSYGDIFVDAPWSDLSAVTIRCRRYAYSHWLGFVSRRDPDQLPASFSSRVTRGSIRHYVEDMRRNCTETTIAVALQRLHSVLRAADPYSDWGWLYRLQRRIARAAKRLPRQRVYSVDLYRIGVEMMNEAKAKRSVFERVVLSQAEQYRDGLMIAMLSETVIRRAGFAALCIDEHVVKIAGRWHIYLDAEMVKTRQEQALEISAELGEYLDDYLATYRPVFPNSDQHTGMWPYIGRPMTDKMIRRYIVKHTTERLGFAVSPHDFRRAAATFIAAADPQNVRVIKDLLGHQSFAMTEKHYIDAASSRQAGRALSAIIGRLAAE